MADLRATTEAPSTRLRAGHAGDIAIEAPAAAEAGDLRRGRSISGRPGTPRPRDDRSEDPHGEANERQFSASQGRPNLQPLRASLERVRGVRQPKRADRRLIKQGPPGVHGTLEK